MHDDNHQIMMQCDSNEIQDALNTLASQRGLAAFGRTGDVKQIAVVTSAFLLGAQAAFGLLKQKLTDATEAARAEHEAAHLKARTRSMRRDGDEHAEIAAAEEQAAADASLDDEEEAPPHLPPELVNGAFPNGFDEPVEPAPTTRPKLRVVRDGDSAEDCPLDN